jgi:hypothetical protein
MDDIKYQNNYDAKQQNYISDRKKTKKKQTCVNVENAPLSYKALYNVYSQNKNKIKIKPHGLQSDHRSINKILSLESSIDNRSNSVYKTRTNFQALVEQKF